MKSKIAGTLTLIVLGLIMIFLPIKSGKQITDSTEVDTESIGDAISPDELGHLIIDKDPQIRIVDLRQPEEYKAFHIKSAINIPMQKLLDSELLDEFDPEKRLVLYTNENTMAIHAQALLRQYGLRNVSVLLGGVNLWKKTYDDPKPPTGYYADADLGRYEFRRSAGIYLLNKKSSFAEISANETSRPTKVKARPRRKRKKGADEGC